jgi:hypothetical protein
MRYYHTAWYVFLGLAAIVIIFELFFRFRYIQAGNHLWRIDRITEQACLVQIGDARCAPDAFPANSRRRINADLESPTPEPNIP